jgi:hypothetical protein
MSGHTRQRSQQLVLIDNGEFYDNTKPRYVNDYGATGRIYITY